MKATTFALAAVLVGSIFFIPRAIWAQEPLESSRYKLEFGPYSIGAPNPTPVAKQPEAKNRDKDKSELSWTDFIVRSGFPQDSSTQPFELSINHTSINLGSLQPETPLLTTVDLSISLGSARGYELSLLADRPPTSSRGKIIPGTICDDDKNPCSAKKAQRWTKSNRFGFGYTLNGDGIAGDFISAQYYRPLPDASKSEEFTSILSRALADGTQKATITYKTLIGNDQPSGVYTNTIYIRALPRY